MITTNANVAVGADDPALIGYADVLARELGLPRCAWPCADYPYVLIYSAADHPLRLELRATHQGAAGPVYVDFTSGTTGFRVRHGSRTVLRTP